jgi:hypothetical protein
MRKCKINNDIKNNKASIDNGADFFIPSQIKQKLFLLVVTCVGDKYSI